MEQNSLEKVKIGRYKGDPLGDSARQFIQKFNNNMEKVLVGENVVSSNQEPSTGLGWDANTQTVYIDLQEDHLTIGTVDGVTPISSSELLKKALASLGISPSGLTQAITDISQHLVYRQTLLDVKQGLDHNYYKLIFIEDRISSLPEGIPPIYVWLEDSDLDPNDNTVIKPNSILLEDSGRWVLYGKGFTNDYQPNSLWVSPEGNDGWGGQSSYQPLENLSTALEKAEEGTVIFLYPGVYELDQTLSIPSKVSLKAYTSHPDSHYHEGDLVIFRGINSDTTLIQANPDTFIEGIRFEGEGVNNPLLLFMETGMPISNQTIATLEEQNNSVSKVKDCSFLPVSEDKSIKAVRATVSDPNLRLKPVYFPHPTVYLENCSFVTYGGIGLEVERFVWANVIRCRFEYNDIAVSAREEGICRIDNSFFNYGNWGLVSADGTSKRCIAEVMSDQDSGEDEIIVRYKWSDSQDPTFPFNPKSFLYLHLLNGSQPFEPLILSTEERIDDGNFIQYRLKLDTNLNQSLTAGMLFEVHQGSVIESSDSVSYYMGAGVDPNDYSGIHLPDRLTQENGKGLAIWS